MMEALACSLEEEEREDQMLRHVFDTSNRPREEAKVGVDKLLQSMLPITEWLGPTCDGSDECPLCLCDYEVGDRIMRLPCLHGAHEECLTQCLDKSAHCPVCKLNVQEALKAMCEQ
jgi:hypothetical protein